MGGFFCFPFAPFYFLQKLPIMLLWNRAVFVAGQHLVYDLHSLNAQAFQYLQQSPVNHFNV